MFNTTNVLKSRNRAFLYPRFIVLPYRSSHRRCSVRKGVLRNFTKFTGNTCARVSFSIKLQDPATLLKKRVWYRCFPANFAKFLRTTFLQNTSGRLLLSLCTNILYGKLKEVLIKLVSFISNRGEKQYIDVVKSVCF